MRIFTLLKCLLLKHEIEYIEELSILAKGKCVRCGGLFCCNKEEGTLLRWDPAWEHDFSRMRNMYQEPESK